MIQITGGEFRGRPVKTPAGLKTRPTQARLRQALFNSIQTHIPGAAVLDLFSGSGALGLEALSRGAEQVIFVENHPSAVKILRANLAAFGVTDRSKILTSSVPTAIESLAQSGQKFQIILADPPYSEGYELSVLKSLSAMNLLEVDGLFCLEWSPLKAKDVELPERMGSLVRVREKNYGDSLLTHFRHSGDTL